MTRVRYEQRSTLLALETYLTTAGWSDITYTDGYQSDETITNPQVVVTFPPSTMRELEMGRTDNKLFNRVVAVNAYMESEPRAQSMVDDIIDFMDDTCIDIVDPAGSTLGTLLVSSSETIRGQVFAPIMSTPKLLRWRGAVQGNFDAFYPASGII